MGGRSFHYDLLDFKINSGLKLKKVNGLPDKVDGCNYNWKNEDN